MSSLLVKLWRLMDFPCGKRLAAVLPWLIPKLEYHGELSFDPETREWDRNLLFTVKIRMAKDLTKYAQSSQH